MSRSNELFYRFRADSHLNGRKSAAKLCTSGISNRREGSSNPTEIARHSQRAPKIAPLRAVPAELQHWARDWLAGMRDSQ